MRLKIMYATQSPHGLELLKCFLVASLSIGLVGWSGGHGDQVGSADPEAAVSRSLSGAGEAKCFEGDSTKRGIVRGDIDGDGHRDATWLGAKLRKGECTYFLKVRLETGTKSVRIDYYEPSLKQHAKPFALVDLSRRKGKEIGLRLSLGANAMYGSSFTLRKGRLVELRFTGGDPDEFSSGGGVGYPSAIDCATRRPGKIVYSAATLNFETNRYKVVRTKYKVVGSRFKIRSSTTKRRVKQGELGDRFPEFKKSPFGTCRGKVLDPYGEA